MEKQEGFLDEIKQWESKLLNSFSGVKSLYQCLSYVCSSDNHYLVCCKNVHNWLYALLSEQHLPLTPVYQKRL